MSDPRMGLGTDQMELPDLSIEEFGQLPPVPRGESGTVPAAMPARGVLAGLAPWADRMQLPGIDT